MPDASLPPTWKSYASPARCRAAITSTGTPRAAQTLLKLTPAAITAISTSPRPGVGVVISSTRKAVRGSPKRVWRMTWASIVDGTSPKGGSAPSFVVSAVDIYCPGLLPFDLWELVYDRYSGPILSPSPAPLPAMRTFLIPRVVIACSFDGKSRRKKCVERSYYVSTSIERLWLSPKPPRLRPECTLERGVGSAEPTVRARSRGNRLPRVAKPRSFR